MREVGGWGGIASPRRCRSPPGPIFRLRTTRAALTPAQPRRGLISAPQFSSCRIARIGWRGVCAASRRKKHEGRCLGLIVLRAVAARRRPRVISRRKLHEGGLLRNSRPNGPHPAVLAGAPVEHGQVAPLYGLVLCLSRTGLQTRRRRAGSILHWNLEYSGSCWGRSRKRQRICQLDKTLSLE